jgi:hypothetical protein
MKKNKINRWANLVAFSIAVGLLIVLVATYVRAGDLTVSYYKEFSDGTVKGIKVFAVLDVYPPADVDWGLFGEIDDEIKKAGWDNGWSAPNIPEWVDNPPKASHMFIFVKKDHVVIIKGGVELPNIHRNANDSSEVIRGGIELLNSRDAKAGDVIVVLEKGIAKPNPDNWLLTKMELNQQYVRWYAAGGSMTLSELKRVSDEILSLGADNETNAWAWAMKIELCARKALGAEQFARWGLLLSLHRVSSETAEAINKRLESFGGSSAVMG